MSDVEIRADKALERIRRVVRAKALIGEVKIESDGEAVPLEYVLIRGFTAMGWKLPATAAGDMIDAIAGSVAPRSLRERLVRTMESTTDEVARNDLRDILAIWRS